MKLLAIDIGASGGRALLGDFSGEKIELRELYRFPNGMIDIGGHKHWKILQLLDEVKQCLRAAGPDIQAVGIDTWGVDYGYIAPDGDLMGMPFAYRDSRIGRGVSAVHEKIPPETLFKLNGLQFLPFNTLYQVAEDIVSRPWIVEKADKLLMMPELLGYFLTGERISEYTIASTSGMVDAASRDWSEKILSDIGFPKERLAGIVGPGEKRIPISADVKRETGTRADFVFTACHDTGSAVAAVPIENADCAYISSGTWSIVGAELDEPILTDEAFANNFTNEGGAGGKIRFLKNVSGLWIVQELQRIWARDGAAMNYERICAEAEKAPPFKSFIDADQECFLAPENMQAAIDSYCRNTGQAVPAGIGATARMVFESLALKYRRVIRLLEIVAGRSIKRIHIVGGGSKNSLLCRMTADACNLPVYAGPSEAAALGNLLVTAVSCGLIENIAEARRLVRRSFSPVEYLPCDAARWDEAAAKFEKLVT